MEEKYIRANMYYCDQHCVDTPNGFTKVELLASDGSKENSYFENPNTAKKFLSAFEFSKEFEPKGQGKFLNPITSENGTSFNIEFDRKDDFNCTMKVYIKKTWKGERTIDKVIKSIKENKYFDLSITEQ